ncbi:MAG: hypothetical protein PHV55_02990 [Candidatus Omnitrophica bacterium]|nr:hypothetical protein [Candidatus Omnitrophota bacterium]
MESITKYKNFIVVVIVITVFAWVGKTMFVDYTSKKAALQAQREAIAKERDLMDRWGMATTEYGTISKRFFEKDPAAFKRFVEDSAQLCNVAINSLSTAKSEEGVLLNVKLNIRAQSSYRNILQFVKALEEKNISVERMAITKKSGGPGIDEEIILRAPVLKE